MRTRDEGEHNRETQRQLGGSMVSPSNPPTTLVRRGWLRGGPEARERLDGRSIAGEVGERWRLVGGVGEELSNVGDERESFGDEGSDEERT